MIVFHVCECGSKDFKMTGAFKEGEKREFKVQCRQCKLEAGYSVTESQLLSFIMCPEVQALYSGYLAANPKPKKKQESLW